MAYRRKAKPVIYDTNLNVRSRLRAALLNAHINERLPLLADCVAKVENRTTRKISRKLIFRLLCCCVAIQRRYEGPWSILDESIWSLTTPRVRRISSSKKFRSSPQKEFFNTIRQKRPVASTLFCARLATRYRPPLMT